MKIRLIILALAGIGLITGCSDNQESTSKDKPKSEMAEKSQPAQAPASQAAAPQQMQRSTAPQTAQPQLSPSEQEALMVIKEHMAKMETEGAQEGELEAPLEGSDKPAEATEKAAAASAAKVKEAIEKSMPQEAKEAIKKVQEGTTTIISPVIQTQATESDSSPATTADTSPTETTPTDTDTANTDTADTDTTDTDTTDTDTTDTDTTDTDTSDSDTQEAPKSEDPCAWLPKIPIEQQQQTVDAMLAKIMQGDTSISADEFKQEANLLVELKKCQ